MGRSGDGGNVERRHALFWWVYFPEFLPPKVREILADPDARVFASAVSAYEMSYKHHRERWPEVEPLVSAFEEIVAAERFDLLPLSAMHAIRAGAHGPEHRDPFDRMLAAQAVVEGLTLGVEGQVVEGGGGGVGKGDGRPARASASHCSSMLEATGIATSLATPA